MVVDPPSLCCRPAQIYTWPLSVVYLALLLQIAHFVLSNGGGSFIA